MVGISSHKKNNWMSISEAGGMFEAQASQEKQRSSPYTSISTDRKTQVPFRYTKKDFLVMTVDPIKEK